MLGSRREMSLELPGLTVMEAEAATMLASGATCRRISEALGTDVGEIRTWLMEARVMGAVETIRGNVEASRRFDLGMAHDLLREAVSEARTSGEMVKATEALMKLHGLDERKGILIEGESADEMEELPDEELMRLSKLDGEDSG